MQRQHPFDLLRGDIIALVIDDQVFLAVGYGNAARLVDMPDIAGVQPAILYHPRGFGFVAPIALHYQRPAHQYLTVFSDLHLGIF